MPLQTIDTTLIAKKQRALKRQYEKAIEVINQLPLSIMGRKDLLDLIDIEFMLQCKQIAGVVMNGIGEVEIPTQTETPIQEEIQL